jgi:hypothetical protein
VLDALEIRFGPVPEALRQTIETIQDEARLRALYQTAIQVASTESFAQAEICTQIVLAAVTAPAGNLAELPDRTVAVDMMSSFR